MPSIPQILSTLAVFAAATVSADTWGKAVGQGPLHAGIAASQGLPIVAHNFNTGLAQGYSRPPRPVSDIFRPLQQGIKKFSSESMAQPQQRRQFEPSPAPPNTPLGFDSDADSMPDEGESGIHEAFDAINGRPSKYTRRYQEAQAKGLNPYTSSTARA